MSTNSYVDFKNKKANPQVQGVLDISPEDLLSKNNDVCIVDVRRPDEWVGEYGHIAEAKHIILDTLPQRLNELPQDKTIVFVCRSGARSAQAAAFALENGFKSTYNMQGGMIAWTEKKFPSIERNGG